MTDPRDDDGWLDAFGPEDLDDPELDALDASVGRVLAGLDGLPAHPPAPRPRRIGPVILALAAALVGAVIVERVASWPADGEGEAPVAPIVSAPELPAAPPAAEVPPRSGGPSSTTPAQAGPSVAGAPRAPERSAGEGGDGVAEAAPEAAAVVVAEPSEAPPSKAPGLVTLGEARFTVDGDAAVLAAGMLSYRHDEDHEPGVSRVRLVDLPLEARPVGTAFRVVARPQVAAVHLTEGRVRLVHDDGTVVSELRPGQEIAAMPDLDGPLGVRLVDTSDLPLDSVRALVPYDCLCRPEDVVAAVASLRLAALAPADPASSRPEPFTEELP